VVEPIEGMLNHMTAIVCERFLSWVLQDLVSVTAISIFEALPRELAERDCERRTDMQQLSLSTSDPNTILRTLSCSMAISPQDDECRLQNTVEA